MNTRCIHAVVLLLGGTGLVCGQQPSPYSANVRQAAVLSTESPPVSAHSVSAHAEAPRTNASDECGRAGGALVWGSAEGLLWWTRPGNLPTLIGTIPGSLATVDPLPDNSITSVFGGSANELDYDEHTGYRISLGCSLCADHAFGIDGNYWRLQRQSIGFSGASNGNPVLGPTYFDPITNRQVIAVFSEPGRLTSTAAAEAQDSLWGFEANGRVRGVSVLSERVDWLLGFRYVQFDEDLAIVSTSTFLPTVPGVGGNRLVVADAFSTGNRFYGVQFGASGEACCDRWFLSWAAKLAVGWTHETVTVLGASADTTPAGVVTPFAGGLLALPTNIGTRTSDKFAVLPEINVNVGYHVTPWLRAFVGYNFFLLTEVARAGDQIDGVDSRGIAYLTSFDPTVTPQNPRPLHESTYLWAHGINVGLEFRF